MEALRELQVARLIVCFSSDHKRQVEYHLRKASTSLREIEDRIEGSEFEGAPDERSLSKGSAFHELSIDEVEKSLLRLEGNLSNAQERSGRLAKLLTPLARLGWRSASIATLALFVFAWGFVSYQGRNKAPVSEFEEFHLVSSIQEWDRLRIDTNLRDEPIMIGGKVYENGFGTHAFSRIDVRLKDPKHRFKGLCGLEDFIGKAGSVICKVFANGMLVGTSPLLTGGGAYWEFTTEVRGAQEITLVVESAEDGNVNDHTSWAALQFE